MSAVAGAHVTDELSIFHIPPGGIDDLADQELLCFAGPGECLHHPMVASPPNECWAKERTQTKAFSAKSRVLC